MEKTFKVGDEVKFKHISYPLGQPPIVTDQKGSVRKIHGEVATVYYMKPENGIFNCKDFPICQLEPVYNQGCGSCMRGSDGEIFYVGTELTVGKITAMEWDKMYAGGIKFNINNEPDYWVAIEVAEKVQARKKLFQTEDGVDIYPGDKYIYIDKFWSIHECPGASGENKTSKKFTTRAAAKEYIVWNKPCLSFTDVEIWLDPAAMRPLQDFIRKKFDL